MKKWISLLCLVLLLTGCGAKVPAKDTAGNPWSKEWTRVGSLLGVESREDWTLNRSEDVLAAEGMFYYVWTKGEAVTYTNAYDETVTSHQAEIHLILSESPSAEDACKNAEQWDQLTAERYPDAETSQSTFAGQAYDITAYPQGAAASGLRGSWAIRVDVICMGEDDPMTVLADFLNRCHYAA